MVTVDPHLRQRDLRPSAFVSVFVVKQALKIMTGTRTYDHSTYKTTQNQKYQISILIRSNEMQQYAGVYLLQNYSTCFGCLSHTSSGVHQNVTAASRTGHSVRATTFRQRGLIWPRWWKVVALKL